MVVCLVVLVRCVVCVSVGRLVVCLFDCSCCVCGVLGRRLVGGSVGCVFDGCDRLCCGLLVVLFCLVVCAFDWHVVCVVLIVGS